MLNFHYADDITLIVDKGSRLKRNLHKVDIERRLDVVILNAKNIKELYVQLVLIVFSKQIKVGNKPVENINDLKYISNKKGQLFKVRITTLNNIWKFLLILLDLSYLTALFG